MSDFKAGDWICFEGKELFKATQNDLDCLAGCDLKLWKPQEGEFMLATDKTKVYLVEFIGFHEERYVCKHFDGFSETFDIVEPFLGELPSLIKETK